MLELRKKLANYQEIFYMLFLLPMTGMTSMGLNSEDRIYLYVFVVATLFLLLKMAVTDFTWREIVIMGIFTLLLGANFLRNGEKTLILTAMGIFGAKNVNLDKVMNYALWEKAVLTVGTLTLAATGVIENGAFDLPKNWEKYTIYSYGYETPNMGFANIAMLNPVIVSKKEPYEAEEGCLSLKGVRKTTRYQEIEVEYEDIHFKKQHQKYKGWVAQIIQHEVDHCEGIII